MRHGATSPISSGPLARETFLLAVALALAEGRPARRSPRRVVARLHATVESVPVRIIDVSYEGIRLEVPERHRSTLPPFFAVRVPMFNVSVVGKRVWVNNALNRDAQNTFWCGVRLERNTDRAKTAWQSLVDHAPASGGTSMSSGRSITCRTGALGAQGLRGAQGAVRCARCGCRCAKVRCARCRCGARCARCGAQVQVRCARCGAQGAVRQVRRK